MPITIEDLETCQGLQLEELEVLESIYPECISSQKSDGTLKLEIPIEFGIPRSVTVKASGPNAPHTNHHDELLSLTVLPPILLEVLLPPSYPLYLPPSIILIRATKNWLVNHLALQAALSQKWESGESALYSWVEYIRSGDFFKDIGSILSDDVTFQIPHPTPQLLASALVEFDSSSKTAQFSQNSYPCSICLTHLKGHKCLQLSCNHIFCRSCLEDFWQLCITEGDVERVGCPDPACVKEGRLASQEEIIRVVPEAEVQRWRWLKNKQELERDPTILHCPVPFCQALVQKPVGTDTESRWDAFRQCPTCSFSFCAFCKYTWHGPISPCPISHTEQLIQEYLKEDTEGRNTLELRYGRRLVHSLVARYEQEQSTKQWIHSSTTSCPGCKSSVEKSMGCNHMTCTRCKHHFCYRCGENLNPDDPYAHFSVPAQRCYKKLFDWDESNEEEWAA